jgi:Undecaprenyl-phosphate galactose phosphotransferase WbaP
MINDLPTMTLTHKRVQHGLGFLLGFGFAFLPGYGPFFGLLFFLSTRWQLRTRDLWWWAAALLCGLPLLVQQAWQPGALAIVQVLVAWLIYRAFGQLYSYRNALPALHERSLSWGLLAGLGLVVSLGWWQIEALNLTAAKTIAQAIVWRSPPSLYGHAVLVLGTLMAVLMPQAPLRLVSMGFAALGILVSGSREAAIAWVIVALALFALNSGRSKRSFWLELGLLAIMFGVALGLSPYLGWGRVGFLLNLAPSVETRANLLQGSEIADGDWWDPLGVEVTEGRVELAGQTLTSYDIRKLSPEGWQRLQQVVTLEAGQTYTLSAFVRSSGLARASLQGWGQLEGNRTFIVIGELIGGRWQASLNGPGRILAYGSEPVGSEPVTDSRASNPTKPEWQRVWISFVYTAQDTDLTWWVGMAPDRRDQLGHATTFAGFQLSPQTTLSTSVLEDYVAGSASQGLGLQVARLPYWQAAWQGFLERPLLGRAQTFSDYYLERGYSNSKIQQPPSHVHNLFLQFLFERGLVGTTGLLLLLTVLIYPLIQQRDIGLLIVIVALLIANLFDYSLFYGAVLYPLVAVAGWRASHYPAVQQSRGQLGVGLYLSLVDMAVAYLSLGLAYALVQGDVSALLTLADDLLPSALRYSFLVYPLLFWRRGLYPGYGLTAAQELRKQVSGSSYAWLALAALLLFFETENPPSVGVLIVMWGLGLLLHPLGRALSKRLLHTLGVWGRSVVILGAGQAGQRVAKALLASPLDGLSPVAFFDDDPNKIGTVINGLAVVGSLAYADVYASKRAVRHAIVAIPTAPAGLMTSLVSRKGRVFTWVQIVPELPGLPAEDVYTGNLDGLLALEVRNGLYAQTSRVFKRSIDVLGASLGGLLISPLLLFIYLWIRLDSPGNAFYWSARIGEGGRPFKCLKFRTMYVDAETRLQDLLASDAKLNAEYNLYHKLENDPRITRAGRILRKVSLDELSQLYNVVIGEMSLIGPRPYLARELDDMGNHAKTILLAKPGMTGYWQVSGRNNVSFAERLEMEAHYVRNWSIWWDIILLLQTVRVVLKREGAH